MGPYKYNAPDITKDPAVMDLQGRMPKPGLQRLPIKPLGLAPPRSATGPLASVKPLGLAPPMPMPGAPAFNDRIPASSPGSDRVADRRGGAGIPQPPAVGPAIGQGIGNAVTATGQAVMPLARQLGSTTATAMATGALLGDNSVPIAAKLPASGGSLVSTVPRNPNYVQDSAAAAEQMFIDEVVSNPDRLASMDARRDSRESLGGIQSRLAASGNSELGFNGQQMGSRVDEGMAARMRAAEQMGSSVPQIGGVVRNGQYSGGDTAYAGSSPLTTGQGVGRYSDEEMARRAGVAERVAANNLLQMERNADKMQEMGYKPTDSFIGGRQYVEGQGQVPVSNAARAMQGMTPEQQELFAARGSAGRQRMEDSAGFRAQRAQARRGFVTNDDGGLDLMATAGLGMQRNDPRGALGAFAASQGADLAARKQSMAEQEMAFAQDPQRFQEQMQLEQLASDPLEAAAKELELTALKEEIARRPVTSAIEGNATMTDMDPSEKLGVFNSVKVARGVGGLAAALQEAAKFTDEDLIAMMNNDPWDLNPFSSSATDPQTKALIQEILDARKGQRPDA